MEPSTGGQLAFTDATYSTTFNVEASGVESLSHPISLAPPSGVLFVTVATPHPLAPNRIETIPDLVAGDQISAAGNSAGTAAAPAGLVIDPTGAFHWSPGSTPQNFWARAYIAADKAWTPWAEITVTGSQSGGFW
jgi:hypothetical protein